MRFFWLLPLFALASCGDPTAPIPRNLVLTAGVSRATVRSGDSVTVTVTVSNVGTTSEDVQGNWCIEQPFVVTTLDAKPVASGTDRLCSADLLIVTIRPGKSLVLTSVWNAITRVGTSTAQAKLPTGKYLITGRLPGVVVRQSTSAAIELTP
jgi:hypothetical protein